MPDRTLDCVIVGYNDFDLQPIMSAREQIRSASGAYRQMLGSVFRYRGKWLHHVDLLNAVLKEATGREYGLHTMALPHLSVCYLKSFLTARGLDVGTVNFYNHEKDRLGTLLQAGPRAVAITTTLYVENSPISDIVQFVRRENPETRIIVGGPHIFDICSIRSVPAQDRLLESIGADIYVHDSQGEAALAALLHELRSPDGGDPGAVPNLVIGKDLARRGSAPAGGSSFVRTARSVEDNDMDENAIDWSLLPRDLYTPTAHIVISRSCPFACSFCRYPAVAGPLRLASVETIETQLRQLHDAGARTLIFADDTPNVPLPRFKRLLTMMIRNGFDFSWFSNFRCSDADAETYDLLKASGCVGVFLGIESGDQGILDNMNKKATVEKYREGIRQLKTRDILTYASFIVGFPGETEETVRNTIRFIEETQPDFYQVHLYYHSRAVPIHRQAGRFGLRGGDYSWQHDTMNWQEACDWIDRIRREVSGPIVCTSYLSSFWLIAYLYGKGISLASIKSFLQLSQPLILHNSEAAIAPPETLEAPLEPEMLSLGTRIARELRAGGPAERRIRSWAMGPKECGQGRPESA